MENVIDKVVSKEGKAVEVKGLVKNFTLKRGKTVEAVRGVDLSVSPGSVVGLLGPNGAGKTTILKVLMGLTHATAGEVFIHGVNVAKDPVKARSLVGWVPEEPSFYGYMSGQALAGFLQGLHPSWREEVFLTRSREFKLPLDIPSERLSRGQRSQLALCLTLARRPEVLLLDEPTAGFDPLARRQFMGILIDEVAARGVSVLLSSHDLDEVERVADVVAIMADGKIRMVREADEMRSCEKKVRAAFQVDPPMELFKHSGVTRVERDGRRFVFTISGDAASFMEQAALVPHFALELMDLSLEDVFMEYTRNDAGGGGGTAL